MSDDALSISPKPDETLFVQKLSLLYTENAKVTAVFWDWRHKLMERSFAVLGGVLLASGWLYHEKELRQFVWITLLVGSIYNITTALLDNVNKRILRGCYKVGHDLEQKIGGGSGTFSRFYPPPTKFTYFWVLQTVYVSLSLALLAATVYAFKNFR